MDSFWVDVWHYCISEILFTVGSKGQGGKLFGKVVEQVFWQVSVLNNLLAVSTKGGFVWAISG